MKHNGIIRWFDAMSGEGMVRLNDGRSVFIHFTAIESVDKNNWHWPKESDKARLSQIENKPCIVLVEDNQVSHCKIIAGL